ncbi:MAG: glycine cleavage system protein GcvH [Thermoplasmata archaeon]|nr:glycine cleavage system protein GcvH [Thermoplasmata archaeon]
MTDPSDPTDRRYTKSHEWVKSEGSQLRVGITHHAQSELTDIVFVDLPKPGKAVGAGESVLVLESVKTVADVYAPTKGTVVAVNEALKKTPELINRDPYGEGWLYLFTPEGPVDEKAFLTADGYRAFVASAAPH